MEKGGGGFGGYFLNIQKISLEISDPLYFLQIAEQFINTYKFYTENKDICCHGKFFRCRIGRRDADVAVVRILSIRNVAPAPVITSPASFAFATIAFAQPSIASKEIKYPPRGLIHEPMPRPPSSLSRTSMTASNFGRMMSACFFICSTIPCTSLKKRTWRSWFTLVVSDCLELQHVTNIF